MNVLDDEMTKLQLREIWKDIFGDSDEYLERFFKKIFHKDYVLVVERDDKVVAMLFMIPYDVKVDGKKYKSIYLYALATVTEYRNKGFMSDLINEANEYADKNGYLFSFLIPAEEELFRFYERFGFDNKFKTDNSLVDNGLIEYKSYEERVKELDKAVILNENQFELWKWSNDMNNKNGNVCIENYVGLIRNGKKAIEENVDLNGIFIGQVLC